ncbi:hypothetical protein JCM3774_006211 [Rhodotorula dairenensis]
MSDDPAATFFPDVDEIPSLYDVLGVQPDCSDEDLKRAYRRLSLLHHPDKVSAAAAATASIAASSSSSHAQEQARATLRFQQIGFAYSVLKEPARREKYDQTGSTAEVSAEGAKTEAEWRDYFKELWSGEVSAQTIDEFKKKYQGSDEERSDILAAYESSAGDLDAILASVMVSTVDDEDRFVDLIDRAIAAGKVKSMPAWKKHSKDTKGKERRRRKADKEAKEAEQLARELGVHDKLFGGGGGGGGSSSGSNKGKGRATAGSKKGTRPQSGGGEADDGEAALRALIQGNQAKRMTSLVDSLEAKYAAIEANNKANRNKNRGKKRTSAAAEDEHGRDNDDDAAPAPSGSKRPRGGGGKKDKEPTEEEFAAIQAKLNARRNGTKST